MSDLDDPIPVLWERAQREGDPRFLLVLADALEERGEAVANGLRRLAALGSRPWYSPGSSHPDLPWVWEEFTNLDVHLALRAEGEHDFDQRGWYVFHSYREAMLAAATAIVSNGTRDETTGIP